VSILDKVRLTLETIDNEKIAVAGRNIGAGRAHRYGCYHCLKHDEHTARRPQTPSAAWMRSVLFVAYLEASLAEQPKQIIFCLYEVGSAEGSV